MDFGFSTPQALWALILLPGVIYIERRAWSSLSRRRRNVVLACRTLEVALLVFALAGLRWERARDAVCVLFAIDASRSVPEEDRVAAIEKVAAATSAMNADDRAGVLAFGRQPLIESIPQAKLTIDTIQANPDEDFTDIASMLRLAVGLFPEGMRRRLVIFSDGNENRGDALETLRTVQSAGISVDVFPIEAPPRNEVSLTRLDLPGRVEKDEPFELKVEALATQAGPATLRYFRDGATLGRQEVVLKEGQNQFSTTFVETKPGFHTYEAIIESPTDAQPENNTAGGFIQVAGPSRVLLVGSDSDSSALANALDLSRINFETAAALPASLRRLQPYDAIILNNVMAAEFSPTQLEELESYVRDLGGGLGMIGGENSFGPGGWIGTPVERALPVRMELKSKEKFPSLALIMVIDKSGSMGGSGGGASKMDMAARATIEAVNLLGPKDLVGVVAFDSAAKWVQHLGSAANRAAISSNVLSIMQGGGTDAYQGALMAYEALAGAKAKLKHIILLTDGHTPPSNFAELTAKMNDSSITMSTVAIGTDADQPFLDGLALAGGGRFYYCPDPSRVPRIFVRETIIVQRSYIIEETETPALAGSHPIMADAGLSAAPPLHGWVATEKKNRAEPVLTIRNDPLLTTWNYGLGKSLAFSSDAKARWAKDWIGWNGFQPFWDRVVRWSMRAVSSTELHPHVGFERGKGRMTVDAASLSGDRLNFLNLKARLIRPDLTVEEIDLRQTAIGHYEAEFDAEEPGAYLTRIFDDQGRLSDAGGMVAFSPEFKDFHSNDYLLHELARQTGGKVDPLIDEIFRHEGEIVRAAQEITPWLLAAVILLLLIEVGVRRLHFDEEQRAKFRQALSRVIPLRLAPAGGAEMDQLGMPAALKARSRLTRARLRKTQEPTEEMDAEPEAVQPVAASEIRQPAKAETSATPEAASSAPSDRPSKLRLSPEAMENLKKDKPRVKSTSLSDSGHEAVEPGNLVERMKKRRAQRRDAGGEPGGEPSGPDLEKPRDAGPRSPGGPGPRPVEKPETSIPETSHGPSGDEPLSSLRERLRKRRQRD